MPKNISPGIPVLTTAGNINSPFEPLGLVFAVVAREEAGCSGGLPVSQAILDATEELKRQTTEAGGNAVLHISYMHRVSSSAGCSGSKSNIEVYAWGTAARV